MQQRIGQKQQHGETGKIHHCRRNTGKQEIRVSEIAQRNHRSRNAPSMATIPPPQYQKPKSQGQGQRVACRHIRRAINAKQQAAHHARDQRGPGQIKTLTLSRAGWGAQKHTQAQRKGREWCAIPIDSRPAEMLHQHAANQRPKPATRGKAKGVKAQNTRAQSLGEMAGGKRGAATNHQRRANALHDARRQKPSVIFRRGAKDKGKNAPGQAQAKHTQIAENIAKAPNAQHQAAIGQHIADHYPLNAGAPKFETLGNRRKGDIYRGIQRHNHRADRDDDQHQNARCTNAGKCTLSAQGTRFQTRRAPPWRQPQPGSPPPGCARNTAPPPPPLPPPNLSSHAPPGPAWHRP